MSIEDPRLSSIDNTSAADEFDSAVEQHLGFASETMEGIEVAQAETPDAGRTDRLPAQQPADVAAAVIPSEVTPDNENVVTLPAGIELDNLEFQVDGENLVLVLADGTEITVIGGAANIPTFVVGDVELPQVALFAALEESNINVAAGPDGTFSAQGAPISSRSFNDDPIGPGPEDLALADLLGDTSFGDELRTAQIFGGNGRPSITTPLTTSFIYDEAVIAGGDGVKIISGRLPFNAGPDSGTITAINFVGASDVNEGDGLKVLGGFTSGGRPITVTSLPAPTDAADLDFIALEGRDSAGNLVFTITVTNRVTGDFTFELVGKLEHPDAGQNGSQDDLDDLLRLGFTYTVTDRDGDSVTGSFNIDVQDDAPTIGAPVDGVVVEDTMSPRGDSPYEPELKLLYDGPDAGFKVSTAEGSLAIRWGADNDLKSEDVSDQNFGDDDPVGRTVSFTGLTEESTYEEIVEAIPVLAGLRSDGTPLDYRIERTVVNGVWNGGYQLIAFKDVPDRGEELDYKELRFSKDDFGGDVFIITLDPTTANGTYTFQLIGNLDHYEPVVIVDEPRGNDTVVVLPPSDTPVLQAVIFDGEVKPSFKPVDFLDFEIPFTATDSDGDSVNGTVTVRVEDDEPVARGEPLLFEVDEDDISTIGRDYPGESLGTSPNDGDERDGSFTGSEYSNGPGAATVSGNLRGIVDFGADNRLTQFSIIDEAAARTALTKLGLTSKGGPLSFDVIGDTLYAFVNAGQPGVEYNAGQDRLVFSLQVQWWGEFKFELHDQVDHDRPSFGADQNSDLQDILPLEDVTAIDFGALIQATDFDGDSTPLTGFVSITITDDVPELVRGASEDRTVDEDDISTLGDRYPGESLGTSPNDGNADGSFTGSQGNNQPGPAFLSGSLASLVKSGADESLTFSFINGDVARGMLESLGLSSKGAELSYEIRNGILYAFDNAGDDLGKSYDPQFGDRLVFELKLNGNGTYEFRLHDQLDHDLGKGENTDLQDGFRYKDVEAIDFGSVIKATDFDGDSVILKDAFSITIKDDVPELSGAKEERLVDEDDIKNGQSTGNFPNDGSGDGSFTGSQNSNGNGPANISGSLANLIKGGADDAVKFSFISEQTAVSALRDLGLSSQGVKLSYDIQGKTLYAYDNDAGNSGYGEGDRLVFKLTVNEDGSYTFELHDQLDHDLGQGENTDLQDGFRYKDVEAIDFGSIIKATDFDGDSVILKDAFSITIKDDVPELSGKEENRLVDEDDIKNGQSTGNSPNDGSGDGSFTGSQNSNGNGPANISGSLSNLIRGGADDTVNFSFISEQTAVSALRYLGLSSKGAELSYDIQGNTLYAYDNNDRNSDYGHGDRLVFKLTVNQDGSYTFELHDQLDHNRGKGENTDLQDDFRYKDVEAIDFGSIIKATDYDGDSVILKDAFSITIKDDVPTAVARNTDETLVVDESDKRQNDDVTGPLDVFRHVGMKGTDPDMSAQFAQQSNFVAATINGGADDDVNVDWALKINGGNGTASGLFTTEGRAIVLFFENGLIVGRYDRPNDGNTEVNSSDPAAFALHLSDNGTLSMVQYVSIKHDDPSDHDENNDANDGDLSTALQTLAGKVNAVLTVTDFDGDKAVSEVAVGDRIQFHDDGPSVKSGSLTIKVDEDGLSSAAPDASRPGEVAGNGFALVSGVAGTLTALFNFGADGAHATEAVTLQPTTLPVDSGLNSQGADVMIKVVGNTLTGYVAGTPERVVFEMKVYANGSYEFELKGQIDHESLDGVASGTNGEFDNAENAVSLDLSRFIVGKDGDGDTVTLTTGKLVIEIQDDIPVLTTANEAITVIAPEVVDPIPGKVANFVLVLDMSGSIDRDLSTLKAQVQDFLAKVSQSGAKDVRVHLVEFGEESSAVGTYDLIVNGAVQQTALNQALQDVRNLNDDGGTNYEAGLQQALQWIEGVASTSIDVTSTLKSFDANSGSGYDRAYIIGNGSKQIALVSGWNVPRDQLADLINANGSTTGGFGASSGLSDTDVDPGQMLRFDFGAFDDFDGPNGYANTENFSGIPVTSATFKLDDNNPGNTQFQYKIVFTDGTFQSSSVVVGNSSTDVVLSGSGANSGKTIAYVEFTVGYGYGDVDLQSVTTLATQPGTLPNADVNQLIFLSDGEPNMTNNGNANVSQAIAAIQNELTAIKTDGDTTGPDQAFKIEAFGINANNTGLVVLGNVEGGTSTNVNSSATLSAAMQSTLSGLAGTPGQTGQPAVGEFDLGDLVKVGADEVVTFGLKADTSALTAQALTVGAVALTYAVVGNVLTAKAGNVTVFTLSIAANGEGTFTLNKPLDGNAAKAIDFSSIIQAVDADGDGVSLTSEKFVITVTPPDTTPPTVVSISMADTALKIGDTSTVTITFSEKVVGFDNNDVTVEKGLLGPLSSADGGITWTAVFTPTTNIEDTTNVVTVGSGYTDVAGNDGTGRVGDNYTVDTKAPVVSSITMSDAALKIGDTSTVTITFSEKVVGFDNNDVTVEKGLLGPLSSADGGITWTAVFTPTTNIEDTTNVVTVGSGYTDVAGNDGTGRVGDNYTVDTKAPTVTITLADDNLTVGQTSLVTFTFSERVEGFSNADLEFENGTLTNVATSNGGLTWTATFTPTAGVNDASNVIRLKAGSVFDLAGNANADASVSGNIVIDTRPTDRDPTGQDKTVNLVEDVTYTFKTSDFGFQDADGHTFAGITVTPPAGTTAGKLMLGNSQISASQFVSAEQIAAGMLTWAPTDNVRSSTGDASFKFSVRDSSGASDGSPNSINLDMSGFNYSDLGDPSNSTFGVGSGYSNISVVGTSDSGGDWINFDIEGVRLSNLNFERSDNNMEIEIGAGNASRTITAINQFTSANAVETVYFGDASYAGYGLGNDGYNIRQGTDGGNGNSNDIIAGSAASEVINGGNGRDLLFGNGGNDTINGDSGNDLISGGLGIDIINGGEGDDVIAGGGGTDTLTGGSGRDRFVWGDELLSSENADRITDYRAQDDIIDLSQLLPANTSSVNYIKLVRDGNDLLVKVDLDGNGNASAPELAYRLVGGNDLASVVINYGGSNKTFTRPTGGWVAAADPIILDLDRNGFDLSSIGAGVTFDIDADGKADQIAWTSDDGILAYDVDGNGQIDNGSEIFTPDFNGGKFASGVAALASHDTNGDGKIDSGDAAFKDLKIWVDANNNGISDEGELSSLFDNGVTSISLTTDNTGGQEDGQTVFSTGTFTFADGSIGDFMEVGFDTIFGSDADPLTVMGTDGDDILHGGMGQVVMTGGAGNDTFVFDGTALDELDVADVIADFNGDGDVLDVTALLDSLLGEQASAETAASHLRATVDDGNTTVSVQTGADTWKDVVVLQNHDTAIKVLFDDKHAVVTPHD
ncbi:T1SS-143 domain-containing protein [Rhizobium sp. RU33A]|uniref:T1SS-143 repeat domain-containing protein n=1 Tax=Rhizobium sp. RU33A TaxID=1907413 RepID=UPI0009561DA8|nr:Ig-like domain-containing protein [Rhizobium sp. RU33A]SIP97922.1 T1SS-143 domain-containing protein [Rhizobium sp. RU33A]